MKNLLLFVLVTLTLTACVPAANTPSPAASETDVPTATTNPTETLQPSAAPDAEQPPIFYINESLPGAVPEPFGPDFFAGSFHSAPVFSPDMTTMWWAGSYGSATIYTSRFVDGVWSDPETIEFSNEITQYRDPFISPDGQRFYFISPKDYSDELSPGKENIWMMTRQGEGWSEPQPLPLEINTLSLHWTVSVAANYDLYYSAGERGNKDIYLSRFVNGTYTNPVALDEPVNSNAMEITPNIAPDGSYLLFSRYTSEDETPYLYISYALESGWSEPVKVENIPYCISPIVTPDGAYVIYLSSASSFGWRDTSFIEELRP